MKTLKFAVAVMACTATLGARAQAPVSWVKDGEKKSVEVHHQIVKEAGKQWVLLKLNNKSKKTQTVTLQGVAKSKGSDQTYLLFSGQPLTVQLSPLSRRTGSTNQKSELRLSNTDLVPTHKAEIESIIIQTIEVE